MQILIFWIFFSFNFKEKRLLIEEGALQKKIVIVEEELGDVEIDDVRNLEDLLRLLFIDVEYENLKVFVNGGELTRNINQIRSQTF